MTGEGGVPEGRKWQAVELVRPLDSNGNVMSVGDTIRHGDTAGEIEYFIACPVIRDGCNQMVVPNALAWDIVPRDSWKKLQEDAAKRVCECTLKLLEEASEACEALKEHDKVQEWHTYQDALCELADVEQCVCNCLQALNPLESEWEDAVQTVRKRNRERGRHEINYAKTLAVDWGEHD